MDLKAKPERVKMVESMKVVYWSLAHGYSPESTQRELIQ